MPAPPLLAAPPVLDPVDPLLPAPGLLLLVPVLLLPAMPLDPVPPVLPVLPLGVPELDIEPEPLLDPVLEPAVLVPAEFEPLVPLALLSFLPQPAMVKASATAAAIVSALVIFELP